MGLAETAQLLVKLTLKDESSETAKKAKASIGDLGKTALMVGGAAGFAALSAGALQAESAQGKFMAATGKSREEAKKFVSDMDSLAGTAGAVGQSFDEIVDTGTQVAQQFQITGQKGRDLTEDILEFAKVTRQDASDAASHLEDTLSAFGLEADDAAGFMDKLTFSSQKFGTDAGPATLSILQGMAPALQAMGEDMDAGIGLLNLFETAGLDAGAAQKGLQKAIQELKPGQNLDDLIAKIGAVEDPTKRAQLAMELFGTRSGVGLANAIKPGMTSLDDFEVSMDEAKGTTEDAAEAMLTTSDRIKGMFDKLAAGSREVGQMFGPLLTGIASLSALGAPVIGKVGATLGGILGAQMGLEVGGPGVVRTLFARLAALAIPLAPAGTTVGTAVGKAMSLGIAGGLILGGAAIGTAIRNIVFEQLDLLLGTTNTEVGVRAKVIGQTMAHFVADGFSKEAANSFAGAAITAYDNALAGGASMDAAMKAAEAAATAAAASFVDKIADMKAGTAQVMRDIGTDTGTRADAADSARSLAYVQADVFADAWAEKAAGNTEVVTGAMKSMAMVAASHAEPAAEDAGDDMGSTFTRSLADAIRNGKDDARDAWDDLIYAMEHPKKRLKDIAWIEGKLASDKLQEGLNSSDPAIRRDAEATKAFLIAQWQNLKGVTYTEAAATSSNLKDGLNEDYPGAKQDARDFVTEYNRVFDALRTSYIVKVTNAGIDGIGNGGNDDGGGRHKRHRGSTQGGDRWGNKQIPDFAVGGEVAAGDLIHVNEGGVQEYFRPHLSGRIVPLAARGQGGGGQMPTVIVNVAITARDVEAASGHRRILQGSGGGFR